jgi:hypothetical protein
MSSTRSIEPSGRQQPHTDPPPPTNAPRAGAPDSHTVRTWTSHRWRTVGAVAAIHSVHSVRPRIVVAAWFVGAPVARMLNASRLGVL